MSAGYESLVRITACPSWATPGTTGLRGYYLFADTTKLSYGGKAVERDAKLIGNRESLPNTFSIDSFEPAGEFTFQPRADDLLMILMAHFQTVVRTGTGTYQFYRINRNMDWTTGGSNVGTNPYSINIDQPFGNSIIQGGTGANGLRLQNCIVEKLVFSNKFNEDLKVTVTVKGLTGSRFNYPTNFNTYPSVYGSVSEFPRCVDYNGTVTIAGDVWDIDAVALNFTNNSADRTKLGIRGWNRFPFVGKWMADGSFDGELERDLEQYGEGTFKNLTTTWQSTGAAGTTIIQITQPNIAIKPYDIDVKDGNSIVELAIPYRAYPPSGTTGPSTIVTVITPGTSIGTALLGF